MSRTVTVTTTETESSSTLLAAGGDPDDSGDGEDGGVDVFEESDEDTGGVSHVRFFGKSDGLSDWPENTPLFEYKLDTDEDCQQPGCEAKDVLLEWGVPEQVLRVKSYATRNWTDVRQVEKKKGQKKKRKKKKKEKKKEKTEQEKHTKEDKRRIMGDAAVKRLAKLSDKVSCLSLCVMLCTSSHVLRSPPSSGPPSRARASNAGKGKGVELWRYPPSGGARFSTDGGRSTRT
jgi:hypothetical protein